MLQAASRVMRIPRLSARFQSGSPRIPTDHAATACQSSASHRSWASCQPAAALATSLSGTRRGPREARQGQDRHDLGLVAAAV